MFRNIYSKIKIKESLNSLIHECKGITHPSENLKYLKELEMPIHCRCSSKGSEYK